MMQNGAKMGPQIDPKIEKIGKKSMRKKVRKKGEKKSAIVRYSPLASARRNARGVPLVNLS